MVRRSLLTLLPDDARRDRRHRRGADHVTARGLRRRAQLGLPLLLAARRRADPGVAARRRLRRRGPASGASGCCARSPATRRTCRSCTPSTAADSCPSASCPTWPGYADSRPVRIGNGAVNQRQNDVLGEVMIALELARSDGLRRRELVGTPALARRGARRALGRAATTASGRSAVRSTTSPTRGSWCGSPSTAPSEPSRTTA